MELKIYKQINSKKMINLMNTCPVVFNNFVVLPLYLKKKKNPMNTNTEFINFTVHMIKKNKSKR